MPIIKVKGIPQEEVLKESTKLIDTLTDVIGCPREYFSIELINNTFVMDGKIVLPPSIIHVAWFDRGQEIQDKVAKVITSHFKKNRECLDVIFQKLCADKYYENGEHF